MHRAAFIMVLSFVLVFALIVGGHAESPSFLYGKVQTSETGMPVKNQPVVIEGHSNWTTIDYIKFWQKPSKEIRVHAVTDDQGTFQVLNLPAGTYTLKALRIGEEPVPIIREFKWDGNTNEIAGKISREKLEPSENKK